MASWWLNTLAFPATCSLLLFAFVMANSDFCGSVSETQPDHALVGHAIKTTVVYDEFECQLKCIANGSCKSFNVHPSSSKTNRRICELNNKTRQMKPKDFKPKKGSTHYGSVKVSCIDNGRQRHGRMSTARNGGQCHPGYAGKKCAVAIGSHPDHPAQSCKHIQDVGISNKNGEYWIDPERNGNPFKVYCDLTTDGGESFVSCKEIYDNHKSQGNKAYLLQMPSGKVPVYCHMSRHALGACGGGGWTLVMKTDGNKLTFHFKSKFWSNKVDFNLTGGKTLFDNHETKLPTYWNTPFSKICLGMKIGHQTRFIAITKHANSLYSLIADGYYRATSLGQNTWKSLLGSSASLQLKCNKEGFNTMGNYPSDSPKARIGIIANEQNACDTPDSKLGFGTGGNPYNSSTCGNEATRFGDKGERKIKAMGYILVQ